MRQDQKAVSETFHVTTREHHIRDRELKISQNDMVYSLVPRLHVFNLEPRPLKIIHDRLYSTLTIYFACCSLIDVLLCSTTRSRRNKFRSASA